MSSNVKGSKNQNFNNEDRQKLNKIFEIVASLKDELDELRNELKKSKDEIRNLKIENGNLRSMLFI